MCSVTSSDAAGVVAPAAPPAHLAIGGVVRLLCEVRLAILAIGLVSSIAQGGITLLGVLLVLVAAPFSYFPAHSWERRGDLLSRSGILLACDLITTVIVLMVIDGELMVVYAAATVGLLGVIVGMRLALVMAIPIALTLVAANRSTPGDEMSWAVLGAGTAGVVGMAWAGNALGVALRAQAAVGNELAATQARRAATVERVRIARDLHDTVAGDLAGAVMLSESLARRLERDDASESSRRTAEQLVETVRTALADTRAALGELRRAETSVHEDLVEICERWAARTAIACSAHVDPRVSEIDPELAVDVRAVALELLENVRRHSGARNASVRIEKRETDVLVEVGDDGCGMDEPEQGADPDGHFGVIGIAERARERGGEVVRSTPPGGGLVTTVTFPLQQRAAVAS